MTPLGAKALIGGGALLGIIALVLASKSGKASGASRVVAPSGLGPGDDFYPDLAPWRRDLLGCVFDHMEMGTLYQWGGGHGHGGDWGLDCSGLVNTCAQLAGMSVAGNADWYYHDLPPVAQPAPGDLALYGSPDRATHVRVVTAWYPDEGRAEAIGAEGGGPSVTTPEIAEAQNARVRYVKNHLAFGSPFLGFQSLEPYGRTAGLSAAPMPPTPPS